MYFLGHCIHDAFIAYTQKTILHVCVVFGYQNQPRSNFDRYTMHDASVDDAHMERRLYSSLIAKQGSKITPDQISMHLDPHPKCQKEANLTQ